MSFTLNNPNFKQPGRRYKVLWIAPELLFDALVNPRTKERVEKICATTLSGFREGFDSLRSAEVLALRVEGMPDDAEIQAMTYDPMANLVGLRVWSASFEEIGMCDMVPKLEVQFAEVRCRVDGAYLDKKTVAGWFEVPPEITPDVRVANDVE